MKKSLLYFNLEHENKLLCLKIEKKIHFPMNINIIYQGFEDFWMQTHLQKGFKTLQWIRSITS